MKVLFNSISVFAFTSLVMAVNDMNGGEQSQRGLPPNRCAPPLIPKVYRNQRWSISSQGLNGVVHAACGDSIDKLRLKMVASHPAIRFAYESKHFIFRRPGSTSCSDCEGEEEQVEDPTGPWNIVSGFFTVDDTEMCLTNENPKSFSAFEKCNTLKLGSGREISAVRKDQQYSIHCEMCSDLGSWGCIIQPWEYTDSIPINPNDPVPRPNTPPQCLTNRHGNGSNVWAFRCSGTADQKFDLSAHRSSLYNQHSSALPNESA